MTTDVNEILAQVDNTVGQLHEGERLVAYARDRLRRLLPAVYSVGIPKAALARRAGLTRQAITRYIPG